MEELIPSLLVVSPFLFIPPPLVEPLLKTNVATKSKVETIVGTIGISIIDT